MVLVAAEAHASSGQGILAEIRQELRVQRALYREPGTLDVSLKQLSGATVLVGSVPSESARGRAEGIVRSMLSGQEIRNRLRVERHDALGPIALRDVVLMAKIEAALEREPGLAGTRRHLDISVVDRNATLRGHVDGPLLAREVVDAVREIDGLSTLNFDQLHF
jgi:osmotically-inducible protein OsmY